MTAVRPSAGRHVILALERLWQDLRDQVRAYNDRTSDLGQELRDHVRAFFKLIGMSFYFLYTDDISVFFFKPFQKPAFAASAVAGPPSVAMTATLRATSSAANVGRRSR